MIITSKDVHLENGKKKKIEILSCKFCANEFLFNSHISNRLKEHIFSSKIHSKKKKEESDRQKAGKQLTINETLVKLREKEVKAETAAYDFVYSLALSALPLNKSSGPLGNLFRKWVPSARTMPSNFILRRDYLPKVFKCQQNYIREMINDRKISIVIDESPDIIGRKTVNTLITFFDEKTKSKKVTLIDCTLTDRVNAGIMKEIIEKSITKMGKTWQDIITISSDSASYMLKLTDSLKKDCKNNLIHINDISHLIHVSISHAFSIKNMEEIREIIIKFGNLFVNANILRVEFYNILKENAVSEKIPKQVVVHRWFSYYITMNDIIELWTYLINFIDSNKSKKILKLKSILGNEKKRHKVYHFIKNEIEFLKPIFNIQKKFENSQADSHLMYSLVNEKLFALIQSPITLMKSSLNLNDQKEVIVILKEFQNAIIVKWKETFERNCDKKIFSENGFLHKISVFDPFKKIQLTNEFDFYKNLFNDFVDSQNLNDLMLEFNCY